MGRKRAPDYNEKRRKKYYIDRTNPEFRENLNLKNKKNKNNNWATTILDKARERSRKHCWEFNLDKNYILELYEKQNGKCYWFDLDMLNCLEDKHPLQPSIDRIDNDKGYTKDNIILTCFAANAGRVDTDAITFIKCLDKINLSKKYNLNLEDINERADVIGIRQKINWPTRLSNSSGNSRYSKECISREFILELNEKQNGLCYWYGVKMETSLKPSYPLQYSLDRIDSTKGYTRDNVVLCSLMANLGKNKTNTNKWIEFSQIVKDRIKLNTENKKYIQTEFNFDSWFM